MKTCIISPFNYLFCVCIEDFWDSVSTQPTCLLCKMVFTTETKRTTHMKYSVRCSCGDCIDL